MRYKLIFLLLISIAMVNVCIAQKVIVHAFMENRKASMESDTIYYDFNRNLKWSDFKGKPDESNFTAPLLRQDLLLIRK